MIDNQPFDPPSPPAATVTGTALAVVPATTPGVGPAAGMAGELVAHVLAELPTLAVLDDRDQVLAAAWLASLRSARTRSLLRR